MAGWNESIKEQLIAKMKAVLSTPPIEDDVSEFVREALRKKLEEDWTRSKARSGLTLEEREALQEVYAGPHEDWRWHLFHVDRAYWQYLTHYDMDEYEPLTAEEVAEGEVSGLRVGMFGTLTVRRGPDRLVCITSITKKGKVKAEKYNVDDDTWTLPAYIDVEDLTETWEQEGE